MQIAIIVLSLCALLIGGFEVWHRRPWWRKYVSDEQFARLRQKIRGRAERENVSFSVDRQTVTFDYPAGVFIVEIHSLARDCSNLPEDEWQPLIDGRVDDLTKQARDYSAELEGEKIGSD